MLSSPLVYHCPTLKDMQTDLKNPLLLAAEIRESDGLKATQAHRMTGLPLEEIILLFRKGRDKELLIVVLQSSRKILKGF
ncbi:hypothetical protein Y032_0136g1960 [Ancylostoma ceylanicum]|uniref:Uncharacterized protein n=1 Tax=Ancylostoma ceylanicum TaxID=53326 RepID=A0A016T5D6_9BILA|nr:hypothetical protein Y032_0136g1960 [Ancylostoma ceylanicum]